MISVIYPLINISTKEESGYYTKTVYDIYIKDKIKYTRGEPMFFTDNTSIKDPKYSSIDKQPKTIEDSSEIEKWDFKYITTPTLKSSNVDFIAAKASYDFINNK